MKIINTLWWIAILLLFSCEKEKSGQLSELEKTGILGIWEIQSYTTNGITDMSIHCCDFLEFKEDSQIADYKGKFRSYGYGYENNGIFELNIKNSSLSINDDDGSQKVFKFQIQNDHLTISYNEDENDIVESWNKIE